MVEVVKQTVDMLAQGGTRGRLHLRAEQDGELLEWEGEYVYVGRLANGMEAFVPAHCDEPIYLHPNEVLSFQEVN